MAAIAVLVVAGVSWIVKPDMAGFIGGGAWLALMLVPSLGLRKAAELVAQQRYASAWRLARLLRFLHPADGLLEQSKMLRALEIAQRGDFASALAILAPLQQQPHERRPPGDRPILSNPRRLGWSARLASRRPASRNHADRFRVAATLPARPRRDRCARRTSPRIHDERPEHDFHAATGLALRCQLAAGPGLWRPPSRTLESPRNEPAQNFARYERVLDCDG